MASFSRRLFETLATGDLLTQLIVLANNTQGLSDAERSEILALSMIQDPRLVGALCAFKIDRNANNLITIWRTILHSELVHPILDHPVIPETHSDHLVTNAVSHTVSPLPEAEEGKTAGPTAVSKVAKVTKALQLINTAKSVRSVRSVHSAVKDPSAPAYSEKDLITLRDQVGLGSANPKTVISLIKGYLSKKDFITKTEFSEMLLKLHKAAEGFSKLKHREASEMLFDLLDVNKNGDLDKDEILNSLVVLVGGSPEDKLSAAFSIYDTDSNGLISFEEMLTHQHAVFKVMFSMNPELKQHCKETSESMALITTEAMFQEIDTNNDRVLTLEEFKAWFNKDAEALEGLNEEKVARVKAVADIKHKAVDAINQTKAALTSNELLGTVSRIKEDTRLHHVHIFDALETFKMGTNTGFFSRQVFMDILYDVITRLAKFPIKDDLFNTVGIELFLMLDRDFNGVVDLYELFSGLSLLCAGSKGDKLKAATTIFDDSGDGTVQFEELTKYFFSVFQMLTLHCGKLQVTVERLANVTAKELFEEMGLDVATGAVGFDHLKLWVDQTMSQFN